MLQLAEAATGFDALMQNLGWTIGVFAAGVIVGGGLVLLKYKKIMKAFKAGQEEA